VDTLVKRKHRRGYRNIFYWYQMKDDINTAIQKCDECSRNKVSSKKPTAALGDMRVGAPMDRLSTDIVGPLPLTPRGNRYILVVTDYFSKWVDVIAIADQSAITTARVLLQLGISTVSFDVSVSQVLWLLQ
jgi:hypothetical protein